MSRPTVRPYVGISVGGEPIGSTILAYFILHEVPTLPEVFGGALILVGIYIASGSEGVEAVEEKMGVPA